MAQAAYSNALIRQQQWKAVITYIDVEESKQKKNDGHST